MRCTIIQLKINCWCVYNTSTYSALEEYIEYEMQLYLLAFTNMHRCEDLCLFDIGSHWLRVQMGRLNSSPFI